MIKNKFNKKINKCNKKIKIQSSKQRTNKW